MRISKETKEKVIEEFKKVHSGNKVYIGQTSVTIEPRGVGELLTIIEAENNRDLIIYLKGYVAGYEYKEVCHTS
jgi:hypothetical protein